MDSTKNKLNTMSGEDCVEIVPVDQPPSCTNSTADNVSKLSRRAFKRLKRQENKLKAKLANDGVNNFERVHVENKRDKAKEMMERKKKVHPYYYDFTANAKGRWFGRKLVDVFVEEFQNYSYDKCKFFIERESLRVEGKKIDVDYVIQNGDVIVNRVHRHELPITDKRIDLISNTEDLLVVDKPASIPIHPCGRYRHNSLLYILAKEYGFRNLRVLYRIDRLTSGLVILAKTEQKTREIMEQIKNRLMEKVYLCKVEGEFPSETTECSKPISVLSEKLGVYFVSEAGKESLTVFRRLFTDGRTSIVRCEPKTGRTHQIRVHLQYLGYPIINDPIYNGTVWGPGKGKHGNFGKTQEQLISDLSGLHKASLYIATNEENKNNNKNNNNNNINNKNNNDDDVVGDNYKDIRNNETIITTNARVSIKNDTTTTNTSSSSIINDTTTNSSSFSSSNVNVNNNDSDDVFPESKKRKIEERNVFIRKSHDINMDNHSVGNDLMTNVNNNNINNNHNINCIEEYQNYHNNNSGDNNNKDITLKSIIHKATADHYDETCTECSVTNLDPIPDQLYICLHALSYRGPDWRYATQLPNWATHLNIDDVMND
ncbi:hypothetical protein HELRODRAFT_173801 [Helobdella robusta]|uniref:Pseudouridine synthase RsuA/RluA-like domain-containing protein n=1 Tax=Helobdella robusta TaxID=6412 RepID=T1F788_HELRO|nr:hypothetical protein HELRODRAFT_173801 [Helobdella robusta]ESO03497.1 hypothetical protein HELRODRAFT_173801 [Helobdella robusta]